MSTTSDQDPGNLREIVEKAYKAFFAEGVDGFMKHMPFHPEAVMIEADGLPYGGTYRGVEAIRRGIETAVATWDDFAGELENVAVSGNLAYVYVHLRGKGKKSGKSFAFPIVEVSRFRDGKVVEFRPFYFDTHRCNSCWEG